jgi:16S rRNA (guanine966-N2)-methyltransferase
MKLRIIAGKYGGRLIEAPGGFLTHPMSERMRGSLFNILSTKIVGAKVLDAFSGSGALALESLSRGAKNAVLVDRSIDSARTIKQNIENLSIDRDINLYNMGVSSWAEKHIDDKFDIIFADPPYQDMQISSLSKLLSLLSFDGIMVLSHPKNFDILKVAPDMHCETRNYGDANLSFLSNR